MATNGRTTVISLEKYCGSVYLHGNPPVTQLPTQLPMKEIEQLYTRRDKVVWQHVTGKTIFEDTYSNIVLTIY